MQRLHRAMAKNPVAGVLSFNPGLVMWWVIHLGQTTLTFLSCKEGIIKGLSKLGMAIPGTER